jgi:shikimate dehydrogenase
LNYIYVPFVVRDLQRAVEGVRHLGVAAVGVTIPYKISIIPFLDELDAEARRVGAVAVVVNRDGRLIGGTTDGQGALKALQEQSDVVGKKVVLLGAGGAARAIAFSLREAGGSLTVLNRAEEIDLAESLGKDLGCPWGDFSRLGSAVTEADLLIQTTPVGMANTPLAGRSLVPAELLRKDMTVMDIVTNPRKTQLLQDAERRGCRVVYGDRMLLWQAVYKFRLYTGVEPPVEVMEQAMERMR